MPVSPQGRSRIMQSIRSKNTKPEKKVRSWLHRHGFRYRLHTPHLPGKPDIVLPKYNSIVEVRGCFWHQHGCDVNRTVRKNLDYWAPKLARNVARDQQNEQALKEMGYKVIVIWECDTKDDAQFEMKMHSIKDEILRNAAK